MTDPASTVLDPIIPHPVYAKQRWISSLNPSRAIVDDVLEQLIGEAHGRLRRRNLEEDA